MATVLRPGGVLSLLVSQRRRLVLAQALAGHIARPGVPTPTTGRFDYARPSAWSRAAGLTWSESHGIGAMADHVAESVIEPNPELTPRLLALEREISHDPVFRRIAPQLHVLARL